MVNGILNSTIQLIVGKYVNQFDDLVSARVFRLISNVIGKQRNTIYCNKLSPIIKITEPV